jgi:hypothetical protein
MFGCVSCNLQVVPARCTRLALHCQLADAIQVDTVKDVVNMLVLYDGQDVCC